MQNSEQRTRLQNGLLYPRVEVEQRTHSGDEIGESLRFDQCRRPSSVIYSHETFCKVDFTYSPGGGGT